MIFSIFHFSLIIMPYILLISHFLYKLIPFDKNPFLITLVFTYALLWFYLIKNKKIEFMTFIIIFSFFCAIVMLRVVFFDESFASIFPLRAAPLLLIFAGLPSNLMTTQERIKQVKHIVVWNTLIQAIIGIVHYYFLPFIITGKEEFVAKAILFEVDFVHPIYTRENGILGNANIYANFILLGIFIVCSKKEYGFKSIIQWIIIIILSWGVILSGSRFPVIINLALVAIFFIKHFSIIEFFLSSLLACFSYLFIYPKLYYVFTRFSEGNSIRDDKVKVALKILNHDWSYFFIGAPNQITSTFKSSAGFVFSDNTFLYFSLIYGVFFTFVWLVYFLMICNASFGMLKNVFFWFYFFAVLWLTNAVLWDIWIIFSLVTVTIISKDKIKSHNLKQYFQLKSI